MNLCEALKGTQTMREDMNTVGRGKKEEEKDKYEKETEKLSTEVHR